MKNPLRTLGVCVAVVGLGWVSAQDASRPQAPAAPAPGDPQRPDDSLALQKLVQTFTSAYNSGDAAALAALFAEDAEIVGEDGSVTEGRAAIQERFADTFAEDPGVVIAIQPDSIRFLSADSAIEKGTATLTSRDGSTPETLRYSVVYARRDGKWLHAMIRDDPRPEPTHHERLMELEWMVGDWINESDDEVVSTTCRWTDDGNFLLREFDVKIEGQVALKGSQRIGWDPVNKQYRTWVFDSEGGFAEGFMAREGDQWLVKSTGVRTDGQPVSATSIITSLDPDRMSWQVVDRTVGAAAMPDIDQFVVVRKAPEPGK